MPAWTRAALALFVVGFGANQFAALLPVYRVADGASAAEVNALFGAYALGLIPALLVVGPLSDRLGRRRVIRPVLVLSFVATVVLLLGGHHLGLLLVGRLLAGVASGAAFAPGTAWVKELSAGPAGTGARRAAIALSAGFGTGPLVTGVVAEWVPHPTVVPYVPHLLLTVAVAVVAWSTPEPAHAPPGDVEAEPGRVGRTLRSRTFLLRVVPTAPWVFGCASFAFTTIPQIQSVPGPDVAVGGALVALTLWTGVLVQPLGRRWAPTTTILLGLASGSAGFLVALLAAELDTGLLVLVAAMLLGAAYGWILVGGLTTVEEVAAPADLAAVNAVFYSLTYIGFAAPFLGTVLLEHVSGPSALLLLAGLVAVCAVPAGLSRRSG
ncbi:MFS transporter [Aeromicrobium sp. Root495]|uniref:MFS transporter n=1 Tax=Aeromicrobium sp. Root495 TaxID=1736550 RepID=UPI000A82896F|nr:MFS transporter [Aeromicrobium sp. Root495]